MKLTNVLSFLVLPVAMAVSPAWADNNRGFFAGAGVSAINVDDSRSFDKANLWVGEIFGGYKFHPWLGGEIRYGKDLGDEKLYLEEPFESIVSDAGQDVVMDVDQYSAVYYRAEAVNQTGRFYALLGYADVEFTIKGAGASATLSEDDFSWGLGAGFILYPNVNLNFEYRNLLDIDDVRFTTITTSLDYRF